MGSSHRPRIAESEVLARVDKYGDKIRTVQYARYNKGKGYRFLEACKAVPFDNYAYMCLNNYLVNRYCYMVLLQQMYHAEYYRGQIILCYSYEKYIFHFSNELHAVKLFKNNLRKMQKTASLPLPANMNDIKLDLSGVKLHGK